MSDIERTSDGLHVVGSGPPEGSTWQYARPEVLVQCCWCGGAILPGEYAMVVVQDTPPRRRWWSHYDTRPCYGTVQCDTPDPEPERTP